MDSFFFLFFYFSFLIVWFYLLKYSGVKILTVSIPSFLIIAIFLFQYLGYPILFFFLDDYRALFVQDRSIILTMFFVTSYIIAFIILGFILAKKTFGKLHLQNQYNYPQQEIVNDKQLSRFILYLLFVLSLLVLMIYISKIGFNNVALLSVLNLTENSISSQVLRSNMGNAFDGKYHWYRLFMSDFLSIVSVGFFGFYLFRKKLFYLFIFIISFFISCFSMTMAIEKAPLLWYFISLFLMYVLIRQNGQFKIKQIIGFGAFASLLISFIYVIFVGSSDLFTGIANAFSRITTGQIHSLYHYFEIFPQRVDFLWGRSLPNPGGLMPYEPFPLTKEVWKIVFPEKIDLNIVGSMPTFFIGEMYANFGYLGIIIPPFFIGFFLYGLNIFLLKLPNTPIFLSFYIWIILHYKKLAATSLSGFIIDTDMFIIFFVLIFILAAPNSLKLRYFKFKNINQSKLNKY